MTKQTQTLTIPVTEEFLRALDWWRERAKIAEAPTREQAIRLLALQALRDTPGFKAHWPIINVSSQKG